MFRAVLQDIVGGTLCGCRCVEHGAFIAFNDLYPVGYVLRVVFPWRVFDAKSRAEKANRTLRKVGELTQYDMMVYYYTDLKLMFHFELEQKFHEQNIHLLQLIRILRHPIIILKLPSQ